MQHLKELTRNLLISMNALPGPSHNLNRGHDPREALRPLVQELLKLDPSDFDESVRSQFITVRSTLEEQTGPKGIHHEHNLMSDGRRLLELLDHYYGPSMGEAPRDFSFVKETRLREIVDRDYRELKDTAYPSKSWKSTVILSGGILEAVLFDRLTRDQPTIDRSMNSPKAPKKRGGVVREILSNEFEDEWKLNDLIKVACDLGFLDAQSEATIHLTLRRYRNLVHARAEVRQPVPLSAGYARSAFGMLDVILDHLATNDSV